MSKTINRTQVTVGGSSEGSSGGCDEEEDLWIHCNSWVDEIGIPTPIPIPCKAATPLPPSSPLTRGAFTDRPRVPVAATIIPLLAAVACLLFPSAPAAAPAAVAAA